MNKNVYTCVGHKVMLVHLLMTCQQNYTLILCAEGFALQCFSLFKYSYPVMPTEQCVFLILYIHSIYGILYMHLSFKNMYN